MRWGGLILIFIFANLALAAQEAPASSPKFQSALSFEGSYNYSGFNLQLAYVLSIKSHEIYAGPKLVVSDSYLPAHGPWGFQLGYRYYWLRKNRFQSFLNFDYQLAFWEVYNPVGFDVEGNNKLHEFHLGYGIRYRLNEHFWIGNALAAGGYVERLIDVQENETDNYTGFSSMISLFVGYSF